MMFWVGLTGGIGSGKSTVARLFGQHGIPIIDADAIARTLTAPGGVALPAIRQQWGDAVFDQRGHLDRDQMRRRVFEAPTQKKQLEALLHPMIYQAIATEQGRYQQHYGMVEIPLLTEAPQFQKLVQRILVVDITEPEQIKRVIQRNNLPEAAVRAIMAQQATRQQRLAIADDVINNDGNLAKLTAAVAQLHRHYQSLAQNIDD